jgi:hypothetical protein
MRTHTAVARLIFILEAPFSDPNSKLAYILACKVCLFYEGTLSVPTQGVPQIPT